jgi:hypothetical protein
MANELSHGNILLIWSPLPICTAYLPFCRPAGTATFARETQCGYQSPCLATNGSQCRPYRRVFRRTKLRCICLRFILASYLQREDPLRNALPCRCSGSIRASLARKGHQEGALRKPSCRLNNASCKSGKPSRQFLKTS